MQLRKYKIKFQQINHIFISHMHGDHYLGLLGFLSSLHLLGREREMHIYGPAELEEVVRVQLKASQTYLRYELHFHVNHGEGKHLILDSKAMTVHSFPLKHRIPTYGFLFSEKTREPNMIKEKLAEYRIPIVKIPEIKRGEDLVLEDGTVVPNAELVTPPPPPRSYAYCSDTAVLPALVDMVKGANLLYHEATFTNEHADRAKVTFHSTAAQAAELAAKAGVHKLLIGHFSARYKTTDTLLSEACARFKNTVAADDGMLVEIPLLAQ